MDLPTWLPPHYAVNPCGCETFVESAIPPDQGKKKPKYVLPGLEGSLQYLNIGMESSTTSTNLEEESDEVKAKNEAIEEKRRKELEEDSRFDYLYRMQETMGEVFQNTAYVHPHGMTDYDYKVIPCNKRKELEDFKMKIRRENYIYLNNHPEIDALMAIFIEKILKAQPSDPIKFAAEFFTFKRVTSDEINEEIEEEKIKLHKYHNPRPDWKRMSVSSSLRKGYSDINEIKSLSLGPLARPFGDTPPPTPPKVPTPSKAIIKKGKFYCGCKDWKIAKARTIPALLKKVKISPPVPENSESEWIGEDAADAGEDALLSMKPSSAFQVLKHPISAIVPPSSVDSAMSSYAQSSEEEQIKPLVKGLSQVLNKEKSKPLTK